VLLRPPPASRWNSPAAANPIEVAALLGDTARATILAALRDGHGRGAAVAFFQLGFIG
jgi:hypothetical protein